MAGQEPQSSADGTRRGRLGRAARAVKSAVIDRSNPVLLVVGGMACFGLVTLGVGIYSTISTAPLDQGTLNKALVELEAGRYAEARELAQTMVDQDTVPTSELGGPPYIFGVIALHEAEHTWDEKGKRKLYLLSSRYLEKARDLGFPPGARAEGMFYLGVSLYHCGRYDDCLPVLEHALELDIGQRSEVYRLLAEAQLRRANPDFTLALEWNRRYLEQTDLAPEEIETGYLQQCDVLLNMNDRAAAEEALAQVPADSARRAEAMVLLGRIRLLEGQEALADPELTSQGANVQASHVALQSAIEVLEQASLNDTLAAQARRKSGYLSAIAYRGLGNLPAARDTLTGTTKLFSDSPEGFAAMLELAEVQLELGDAQAAASVLTDLLRAAPTPQEFHNPWLTLNDLRRRLRAAVERLGEMNQFEQAVTLSRGMYPLIPREESVTLAAGYEKAWAEMLEAQSLLPTAEDPEKLASEARLHYRGAGGMYGRLAMLHETTRQYPEHVWESAHCYLAGHDYENAVIMFREYLENDARGNRALALVGLGEGLLAREHTEEAVKAWTECIEMYPADPATYRARILSSLAYLELGNTKEAEALLRQNLDHSDLTPASLEWRDSLYALGKLLHAQGVTDAAQARSKGLDDGIAAHRDEAMEYLEKSYESFTEASRLLRWAIERHPDAPQSLEARYLLADSYRQVGAYLLERRRDATIESMRLSLYAQAQEKYEDSLTQYTQLTEALNSRQQAQSELTDWEAKILRNCYFARGTVLFDLERYEEAIQAYSSATSRFQHRPEALEAYVQIAAAQRRLQRHVAARGTLEQARLVIDRIETDAEFTRTTRYSREEWISLLEWLSSI